MTKLLLNISENAQDDLENIYLYSFNSWGELQANLYVKALNQAILMLIENPYIGKVAEDINKAFRYFPANKHIVFYSILESELRILRILHESAHYKAHLQ